MESLLLILRQLYLRCDPTILTPVKRNDPPIDSVTTTTTTTIPTTLLSLPSGLSLTRISSETWQRKKLKRVLQKGAELFNDKPRKGLMYLVSEGMIAPLSPASVANFLRTAPGLNDEAIGKYLGESGHPEVSSRRRQAGGGGGGEGRSSLACCCIGNLPFLALPHPR